MRLLAQLSPTLMITWQYYNTALAEVRDWWNVAASGALLSATSCFWLPRSHKIKQRPEKPRPVRRGSSVTNSMVGSCHHILLLWMHLDPLHLWFFNGVEGINYHFIINLFCICRCNLGRVYIFLVLLREAKIECRNKSSLFQSLCCGTKV